MFILLVASILSTLFCLFVHYVLKPLAVHFYYKYEPLFFHWSFKSWKKREKVYKKLIETGSKALYLIKRKSMF
jgi:hypothetical protein